MLLGWPLVKLLLQLLRPQGLVLMLATMLELVLEFVF
jgi:hypothetical protein